ncbi:MAG: cytochrome P450 [Acidimicrobiia bacterium]
MTTYDTTDGVDGSAVLFDPTVANHPHEAYDKLRTECPVSRGAGWDGHPHVIVSRYEDVIWSLKHPEVFSSAPEAVNIGQEQKLIPLQVDPPEHAKYRRLLDPEFSPKRMNALEPEVRTLINTLIDTFIDRGSCNVHEELATPLPSGVFLALMGLPMSDLPMFLRWRDETIRPDVPVGDLEAAAAARERVSHELSEYFEEMVAERRKNPDDRLLTRVAHGEVDGRPLDREETLGICHLLMLGGLDTVTATLDCALAYLAANPGRRQAVVDDPALAAVAVEELLRHQSPVMMVVRVLKEDCELAGQQLKAGDHATILIGAANSDDAEFSDANGVDFSREANRHLAFGAGPHRCLGSNLARVELRIALEEWHRRIPDYRIADGTELTYSLGIRQTAELPLVWG